MLRLISQLSYDVSPHHLRTSPPNVPLARIPRSFLADDDGGRATFLHMPDHRVPWEFTHHEQRA